MQTSVTLQINGPLLSQIDKELAGLTLLSRMPALKKGFRDAGDIVKNRIKETLPKPGYPGDKPGLTPLRNTVQTKVAEYPSGKLVTIVGYSWHAGGQHGHNVEEGHEIVVGGTSPDPGKGRKTPLMSKRTGVRGGGTIRGRVAGRYDIANAAQATESQQGSAILAAISDAIAETKKV